MRRRSPSAPRRALALAMLLGSGTASLECQGRSFLDDLGTRLSFASEDGDRWVRLSSMSDITMYVPDDPAPGLLFSDDATFVAPRVSVTLEGGLGQRLLFHARASADRGFDPGSDKGGDLRLDEYFAEVSLTEAGGTRLRMGKFATAFGAWVDRHRSWDSPLITAPALYEDMLPITDQTAPADFADFAARRDAPENKPGWVPAVWGPSYATGASLSTGTSTLDATLEVKNAAVSSRPETWDAVNEGFDTDPTITGRLGWHPDPAWTVGASFSRGSYLQEEAGPSLPAGADVDDFRQTTLGLDVTYELRRVQVWGELARAEFEVPRVGEVDLLSGFLEVRYKVAPRIWLAGRWNQSRFEDAPGIDQSWDRHLRRLDLGVGFRHSAHVQAKVEYSAGDQAGEDTGGNELLALQLVVWF